MASTRYHQYNILFCKYYDNLKSQRCWTGILRYLQVEHLPLPNVITILLYSFYDKVWILTILLKLAVKVTWSEQWYNGESFICRIYRILQYLGWQFDIFIIFKNTAKYKHRQISDWLSKWSLCDKKVMENIPYR